VKVTVIGAGNVGATTAMRIAQSDICREVVEMGPINASIHRLDEHIAVEDLDALSRIYRLALANVLNGR